MTCWRDITEHAHAQARLVKYEFNHDYVTRSLREMLERCSYFFFRNGGSEICSTAVDEMQRNAKDLSVVVSGGEISMELPYELDDEGNVEWTRMRVPVPNWDYS